MMLRILAPIFLTALPSFVIGHGHITNIVINSVSYSGWDIDTYPYESDPPTVVAWGTPNTSNGFITPEIIDQYNTSDIICHLNATNAKGHAAVQAGDSINLVWTSWPSSHHGPVITYLANCGDSCETVDKTTLEFFKIDAVGLVDDTDVPGTWGDDELISNNNSWMVEIPPTLKAGYYVMRHELIALHSAGAEDGAQNYPQCFNLQVIGSGTAQPSGVLGTDLYSPTDAGILVNIYTSLSYEIPGPTLFTGAVSVAQATSAITASGTPTTGSDAGAQTTTSTVTSPSTSTSAVSTVTTSVSTSSTTSAPTTLIVTTSTTQKTTTAAPTTSSAGSSAGGTTQSVYGQCGGSNWTGATACNAQATCSSMNPYYYQCVPTAV